MVQTRSQTHSNKEFWPLIGTLKEVRIPARPPSRENLKQLQVSHPGHTTQALAPPQPPTQASLSLTTSNKASQLSALTKVFNTATLILQLDAPTSCLLILHALRSTINDFITNYTNYSVKWLPTRPHLEINQDEVRKVLDVVHCTAHEMAESGEEDVKDIAHAAKWAIDLFESTSFNVKGWELEGVSEVHLGMWQFVGWMEVDCYWLQDFDTN